MVGGSKAYSNTRRRLKEGTYYGIPGKLGSGLIRTFVTINDDQEPIEVGIEATVGLFDSDKLPTRESDGRNDVLDEDNNVVWYCCGHEVNLDFPIQVKNLIPFDHFVLNWNPKGVSFQHISIHSSL